jgi:integrase
VWAKKIRGRLHYFGPWDDPDAALKKYLDQKEALHAGRTPRPDPDAFTVKDLANAFLNAKQSRVDTGELSPLTWGDYKAAADEAVAAFGRGRLVTDLRPADFAALRDRMARKWGLQRLCKTIQFVRCIFKYAYDAELTAAPVRFGPDFKRPAKREFRVHRARQGPKLFTADEVRRMLGTAKQPLRAMLLLGMNCGFGPSDVGHLPAAALDLDGGWVNYPRPKTGIARRCALWPETVQAVREARAGRPEPKEAGHAGLVFLTRRGDPWAKEDVSGPVTRETRKLLARLGINGRKGLGFYALRHTFRTVADGAKDQPAADYIMGHEVAHMSSHYREGIDDGRLRAVADHVRAWLFPATAANPAPAIPG